MTYVYYFSFVEEACGNFDFEKGTLEGWTARGSAFHYQPTLGDNILARTSGSSKTTSGHQGNWWIGTYENRSSADIPAGNIQGDASTGNIMSSLIRITGPNANFLIGGSCNSSARVYFWVGFRLLPFFDTLNCKEHMMRVRFRAFDAYIGKVGRIVLMDLDDSPGGHINFDDFRGDFICLGKLVNSFLILTFGQTVLSEI